MKILLAILLLASVPFAAVADDALRAEIDHLLAFVGSADVVFIRNKKEHTAKEAVEHMKKKADHFEDKIKSAEDFIAYSATKSLLSGKVYTVRLKDGTVKPCAEWLLDELKRYRAQAKKGKATAPRPETAAGAAKAAE